MTDEVKYKLIWYRQPNVEYRWAHGIHNHLENVLFTDGLGWGELTFPNNFIVTPELYNNCLSYLKKNTLSEGAKEGNNQNLILDKTTLHYNWLYDSIRLTSLNITDIPIPINGCCCSFEELDKAYSKFIELGIKVVKIKIDAVTQLSRLSEILTSFPEFEFRLDFNGLLSLDELLDSWLDLAPEIKRRIQYYEEPFRSIEEYKELRDLQDPPPIAFDHFGHNVDDLILHYQSMPATIIFKPAAFGSLLNIETEYRKAKEAGFQVVITSSLESAIGIYNCFRLTQYLENSMVPNGLSLYMRSLNSNIPEPIISDGKMIAWDRKGVIEGVLKCIDIVQESSW